ncbi:hypothetical protein FFLO_01348 [Filobasidium floriforme]|uniref:protein-histidine N-methyltransferase n=1 Tax=Filobasidium floriforme TaxID=5210 RepID=A0A8K0NQ30_9TREE|nr:hypothetical protein FFLO_01348 [Filobasidium floriforme]
MFKFDFSIDDEAGSDDEVQVTLSTGAGSSKTQAAAGEQHESVPYLSSTVEELVAHLPTSISYSPLHLTVAGETREILRRDLYDARFQVIDQREGDEPTAEEDSESKYVDADTDLIPGTYEGGLKTWEGGVDLVEVLAEYDQKTHKLVERIRGKRVMEVGCGTALPTLYLLQRLLEAPISDDTPTTTLHLQDYNLSVLHLVTLPNLILAVIPNDQFDQESDDLDLSPQIVETFKSRLAEHKIELEFSYGPWQGLAEHLRQSTQKQDIILTAETIYRDDSVSSLLDVLRFGSTLHSTVVTRIEGLEDLDKLDLGSKWPETETVILVAAKILYFGVGGGLVDFIRQVEARGGESEDVKSWPKGVGRKVVRLSWPEAT